MTERLEVYKCMVCGNIVQVLHSGRGQLVCCGQPMVRQEERTADQGKEKHLPVVEKTDAGVSVKVGSVAHPMEERHFIEWIEVVVPDGVSRKSLDPGEAPEAVFAAEGDVLQVRAYCNVHGLWATKEA